MRIGDLRKQLAFDDKTNEGAHYSLVSKNKDVKLEEIFSTLQTFFEGMPKAEKEILRDLCLMLSHGNIPDPETDDGRAHVLRFIVGFLLGRYFTKTDTQVYTEEVRVSRGEDLI